MRVNGRIWTILMLAVLMTLHEATGQELPIPSVISENLSAGLSQLPGNLDTARCSIAGVLGLGNSGCLSPPPPPAPSPPPPPENPPPPPSPPPTAPSPPPPPVNPPPSPSSPPPGSPPPSSPPPSSPPPSSPPPGSPPPSSPPPPILPPPVQLSGPVPSPAPSIVSPSPAPSSKGQCPVQGTVLNIVNPEFNLTSGGSSSQNSDYVPGWVVSPGNSPKYMFGQGIGFSYGSAAFDSVSQSVATAIKCQYQLVFTLVVANSIRADNSFNVTVNGIVPTDSSNAALNFQNLETGAFPIIGSFTARDSFSVIKFSGRARTGSISLHSVELSAL